MLNKKKNNKQEKLKQTQRTGLLFFTNMLVLFAFLTLVACPDGSTSGSSGSSGTDGDQGSSTLMGTFSYTKINTVFGTTTSSGAPSWTGATPEQIAAQTVSYSISPSVAGITIDSNTGVISVSATAAAMASTGFTVTATDTRNYGGTKTATVNIAVTTAREAWNAETGAITSTTTGTEITTVQGLKDISNDLTATYYLGNDIDISGAAWTPIGSVGTPFTGTLHGNGYAITGLTIGDAGITPAIDGAVDYQGLFGVIDGATIENLFIEVTHIYANAVAGALVGMVDSTNNSASTLTNIAVAGVNTSTIIQATGKVTLGTLSGAYLGGVVGYMKNTGATSTNDPRHTIIAYNYGLKVESTDLAEGDYVGGAVGYGDTSYIESYTTGDVSGNRSVGGQVGQVNDSSTVSGYATGVVSGTGYNVGGQVGYADSSTVSGYATGAVSGKNVVGGQVGYADSSTVSGYATGAVIGNGRVGGQVGQANDNSTVNGYATGDVSGSVGVGGQVGAASGSSTVNGYAIGDVSGDEYVGGQVGVSNDATVSGYAHGTVRRKRGKNTSFGMLVGGILNNSITSGFNSATESALLDSDGTTALTATTGIDGTAITMGPDIMQATFSPGTGDTLTFGTAVGEWKWVADGQWPAINIGLR